MRSDWQRFLPGRKKGKRTKNRADEVRYPEISAGLLEVGLEFKCRKGRKCNQPQ